MEPERSEPASAPTEAAWALRPGEPGDLEYIASSWRRNYIDDRKTQEQRWWQAAVVALCLVNSEVLVAHPVERREQILGWCCFRRPNVLHYVFTKPYYRRHGIGWALVEEAMLSTFGAHYATHQWQRPHADGIGVMVTKARALGIDVVHSPSLIFEERKRP